ncbi:MAG: response regulator transcription factor [Sulfurovum sp.]|nr:response regulator transcription factor [Sulfurovum sp.]
MIRTRVLLCEDEKDAREILSFYLNTIFEEVVVAEDGLEGLEIYKKNFKNNTEFDLILTDIKMPNMDGIEMLETIHEINKNQKFIIVSAYQDEEKLLKSINLRVLGYFVKPLNVDNIMEMLQKAKEEVLKERQSNIKINLIYTYDINEKLLYENSKIVKLSRRETQVLDILMRSQGKIVPTDRFKEEIWGSIEKLDSTFRTVVKRLKDKIKKDDFILSRKGQGYMIE